MKMSPEGIALLQHFEQCKLEAYLCPAGKWTIGWGHTGSGVHPGLVITQDQADEILRRDLERCAQEVSRVCTAQLYQHQFDALCDFEYNKGCPALVGSTLLKMVNAGRYDAAAEEFQRWIYGGDGTHNGVDDDGDGLVDEAGERQRLRGLVRRAVAQSALFRGQPWQLALNNHIKAGG